MQQYYSLSKREGKQTDTFFFFFNQKQSISLNFIDFNRGQFRPKSQRQENEVLNDWVVQAE